MRSWGIASSLAMAWTSVATAQPADVTAGAGGATNSPAVALGYGAMPGGLKAPSAETLPKGMFGVSLMGGFGVRSKLLGDDHKLQRGIGDIAFAFAPIDSLTLGLAFDGRFDQHEGLDPDGDDGYVGDPRLIARFGKKLGKVSAGGQLTILVPGKDAPSVAASAISVEARGLFSVAAGPGTLSLNAGVRIDNSAKSVVDEDGNDNRMLLSAEDRVSLGVSDYHAMVAGLHYLLPVGQKAYVGVEGSLDLFFGEHLPDGITAPDKPGQIFRFGAQGGVHLTKQWTAFAFLQGAVVPKISAADLTAGNIALVPYEPLFTGGLAIAARFGGPSRSGGGGGGIEAHDCEKNPEKCKPITVAITADVTGSVVDDSGKPVAGAKISVRLKTNTGTAVTDEKGEFTVANLPIGKTVNNKTELDDLGAEVTVEVEGKKPKTTTLTLKEGKDNKVPVITLDPVLPPGQFKAVVRAAGTGKPLAGVTVKLEPGGASAVSDTDGNLSLDVQPGTYKATASGAGFKEQTLDVVIEQSAVVVKQFELTK
jgi:hypothetical protein